MWKTVLTVAVTVWVLNAIGLSNPLGGILGRSTTTG